MNRLRLDAEAEAGCRGFGAGLDVGAENLFIHF